ncbi:MAG TPA: hypothetical protein VEA37_00905 [Flavobacterium sp.]|nr:hypothetical protein [Flavobacterium sp.]
MKLPFYILLLTLFYNSHFFIGEGIKITAASNKTQYEHGEDIVISITLKNVSSEAQEVLFDKSTPYGPWYSTISLIDLKTGKSVLKYPTGAELHSQVYSQEEFKKYMTILKPGEAYTKEYKLTDMVILASKDNLLPKGEYALEILWEGNYEIYYSNKITFVVK